MRCLVLTTDVHGLGGIQFAGKAMLAALGERFRENIEITVVSLLDRVAKKTANGASWQLRGANRSHGRMVLLAVSAWREQRWDLVILGHVNLAPLLLVGKRLSAAPVLAVAYGLDVWRPLSRLQRWGLQSADRLLYISDHSRRQANEVSPWLAKIPDVVCHLGLMREETAANREPRPECKDGPVRDFALAIGRMESGERYKGQEELIRVWREVEARRPGLELVLIGDGDDRPRLERLADELRSPVRFLGAVDDATRDRYLRDCCCFCLPSRGEGFGLVYLEAMRQRKSVLAGNTDAGREVVMDGITGRTVDPRNPQQLVEAILDVSGERSVAMGEAGFQRYQELFTFERFAERFCRIVQQTARR